MVNQTIIGLIAATSLAIASTGHLAAESPTTAYTLARSTERTMKSATGAEYRIMVSVPEGEPPSAGYPILYVLDGDDLFPVTTSLLRLQGGTAKLAKHNGIAPGIIVGIGYPNESRRDYDYTPPAAPGAPETYRNGKPYPSRPAGGADQLLEFIVSELKPLMEKELRVDQQKQTLMGNGYGGLFTLHTLFTRPSEFQTYVAASPSIWWNDRYILQEAAAFSKMPAAANLILTVGEQEQSLTRIEAAWPEDEREEHRLKISRRRMVDLTRELYWQLEALESPGFKVSFRSFPGESHKSVIPMSINHALPLVFPAQQ
jgi:predicted alpha/beta superfamily hydrolase